MSERNMLGYKEKIEAKALSQLSNESAIKWLKVNSLSDDHNSSSACVSEDVRGIANFCYYKRNDSSLMLALARYGTHLSTLKKIFLSSDRTVKLAVLTNPLVGPSSRLEEAGIHRILSEGDVLEIIQNYPSNGQMLNALLENPKINRESLGDIISRKGQYENLDESLLFRIVSILSESPIISEQRKDNGILDPFDGLADASFNELNLNLLKLILSVPANPSWAYCLTNVLARLHAPYIPDEITFDLLERWNIDGEISDEVNGSGFWIRFEIAKLIFRSRRKERKTFIAPEHKDKAVRLAYYSLVKPDELFAFDIHYNNFPYVRFDHIGEHEVTKTQQLVIDKCKELFELDGNDFIKKLIENVNFWERKKERKFLNDIAWNLAEDDLGMMVPNTYNWTQERMSINYPHYFEDDEVEELAEEESVKIKMEVIRELLEKMEKSFQGSLKTEITESQTSNYHDLKKELEFQFRDFSAGLNQKSDDVARDSNLRERLDRIENSMRERQVGMFWKWSVILLLIFIILKIS
jgi:hypothetical protein